MSKTYTFIVNAIGNVYQFNSIGTKGTIRKTIKFVQLVLNFYNAALGDQTESDEVNFEADSNNDDIFMILNTAAAIIEHFSLSHPEALIFIAGSENRRTRAYQWRLKKYLQSAEVKFCFLGLKESDNWESFKEGESYHAFLVVPLQ